MYEAADASCATTKAICTIPTAGKVIAVTRKATFSLLVTLAVIGVALLILLQILFWPRSVPEKPPLSDGTLKSDGSEQLTAAITPTSAPDSIPTRATDEFSFGGVVLDNHDEPVPSAKVELLTLETGEAVSGTVADSSGSFCFKSLPAARYLSSATSADYFPGPPMEISIPDISEATLRLIKPETIAGRVVGFRNGTGIASARVLVITQEISDDVISGFVRVCRTKEDGRFALTSFRPGDYIIRTEAERFLPHIERNVIAGTKDLLISMRDLGVIEGEVVDDQSRPVLMADVSISLVTGTGLVAMRELTAQNGLFSFSDLPIGTYRLHASSEKHDCVAESSADVVLDTDHELVKLVLRRKFFSISGHVRDADTGQGIPEVSIIARPQMFGAAFRIYERLMRSCPKSETDENGAYEVTGLTMGNYLVVPDESSLSNRPYTLVLEGTYEKEGRQVRIVDQNVTDVDFLAVGSSSISGRVLDEAGAVVEGATVCIRYKYETHRDDFVLSNEVGEYAFPKLRFRTPSESTSIRVVAHHPVYGGGESEEVLYKPGEVLTEVDVILNNEGEVFGTVKCQDEPLLEEAFSVFVYDVYGSDSPKISYLPGGQYKVDRVPLGDVTIDVTAPGYEMARHFAFLTKDAPSQRIDFHLTKKENLVIAGRVGDTEGRPLSNVHIYCIGLEPGVEGKISNEEDGTYEIGGLRPGKYNVFFEMKTPPNYKSWLLGVDSGTTNADATLGFEPISVEGQLIQEDGSPCPYGMLLFLWQVDREGRPISLDGERGTGKFTAQIFSPGQYRIGTMPSRSRRLQGLASFEISPDSPKNMSVDVVMRGANCRLITGKFVRQDGSAIVRAVYTIRPLDDLNMFPYPTSLVGPRGEFCFLVPPGAYAATFTSLTGTTNVTLFVEDEDIIDLLVQEEL
ncbi:MAG: hypothetical protein ABIH23_25855 [bacterium]